MLSYTDLKPGVMFIKDGEPFVVLEYNHSKKQRGAPIVQLKIKNLITNKTKDVSARQNESFEEADIKEIMAEFLYYQEYKEEFWFKNIDNPGDRFMLEKDMVGDMKNYLKSGLEIKLLKFSDKFINILLPIKVDFKVTQAPPSLRGNTADGGTKQVTIETGHKVSTPLFIEKGDIIRINTETGEYTERVS